MSGRPARVRVMNLGEKNSSALAGFVLGVVSAVIAFITGALIGTTVGGLFVAFLLAALPALLAVIFGIVGLTKAGGGRRSQAIWAIIFGFTPWASALLGMIVKLSLFG